MEKELELVGATAIEDQLQDGVPETIEMLLRAGLKIWMITGDKVETAITIGLSCKLITNETKILTLRNASSINGNDSIIPDDYYYNELIGFKEEIEQEKQKCEMENRQFNVGVVFEAGALQVIMEKYKELFTQVILNATVVLCCRVTPKQKAMIAKTVKESTKKVVLTIGDGANDVAMINEGNIGIGLFGKKEHKQHEHLIMHYVNLDIFQN